MKVVVRVSSLLLLLTIELTIQTTAFREGLKAKQYKISTFYCNGFVIHIEKLWLFRTNELSKLFAPEGFQCDVSRQIHQLE